MCRALFVRTGSRGARHDPGRLLFRLDELNLDKVLKQEGTWKKLGFPEDD
jgi:hypothetical protein